MFPVLLAAGAQPAADWIGRTHARLRRGLLAAALVLSAAEFPVTLPIVPVSAVHKTPIVSLNYDAGETIGWPAFVQEIARVYGGLPATQRSGAIVLASNYGEAGAVDRFGPADGLPPAYSGHMSYWYWGPPPERATAAIAVGFDKADLGFCGSAVLAATLNNHVGVADDEQGQPVWICSQLRESWPAIWPSLRNLG
jgi:hypothetical protein